MARLFLVVMMVPMLCACSSQPADSIDPILSMQVHTPRPIEGNWQESYELIIEIDSSLSALDMATKGFESWISQYTRSDTPVDYGIVEFRIDSILDSDDPYFVEDYDYAFRVHYSVRPTNIQSSRWIAADGRLTSDGWVLSKGHYLGIMISHDSAAIYILGPCPMC